MFRSLRHYNARLFFAGLLVSNVGTWLQLTAMALLVYRLTGRATDLGITFALQFLPMLLLGAWAGAVADQRDKRTLAIVTQAGLAAQAFVLGLLDLFGSLSVGAVWSLTIVLGVLNAFDNPARRGLVIELVDPEDISNATALEHRRDDRLADLRAGPRRDPGRVGRHVVVLPAQRGVVRCRARLAVQPARR